MGSRRHATAASLTARCLLSAILLSLAVTPAALAGSGASADHKPGDRKAGPCTHKATKTKRKQKQTKPLPCAHGRKPAKPMTASAPKRPGKPSKPQRNGDLAERVRVLEHQVAQLHEAIDQLRTEMSQQRQPTLVQALPCHHDHAKHEAAPCTQAGVVRTYALPPGIYEDMVALMVREDVPLIVRPLEGAIEVHGTVDQHHAFAAFVKLISTEPDHARHYVLPPGRREAFARLMVRPDVPVLVHPGEGGMGIVGSGWEQGIVADFIRLIDPSHGQEAQDESSMPVAPMQQTAPPPAERPHGAFTLHGTLTRHPAAALQTHGCGKEHPGETPSPAQPSDKADAPTTPHSAATFLARSLDNLRGRVHEMETKADKLEARALALSKSLVDGTAEGPVHATKQEIHNLTARARNLRGQASVLNKQIEKIEKESNPRPAKNQPPRSVQASANTR